MMTGKTKYMKNSLIGLITIGMVCSFQGLAQDNNKSALKDQKDRISYGIGFNLANSLKNSGIEINQDLLFQAVKDVLNDKPTLLNETEVREVLTSLQKDMRAKMEEKRKTAAETNKKEGEAFLAENKSKPGVVTLPSGLQYKVLQEGKGKSPSSNDTVTVHYRGTLLDGTEFDSSYQRNQPATFKVNGVIKGWTEALQLMKEGAKWQLFIPSQLAYGEFGAGQKIGPNSTLIFDVELLEVKAPEPITSDIIKVPSAEEMKKGAQIEVIKKEELEKLKK